MTTHRWNYEIFEWYDLDRSHRDLFEEFEIEVMALSRNLGRLDEVRLTVDQVEKLFGNAEELSRNKNLKTAFGNSMQFPQDTLRTVNRLLSNFSKKLQNSGTVQAADAKFEQIKQRLIKDLGTKAAGKRILSYIDVLGEAAKNHPAWQGAIIGVLTAISGVVFGPASLPVMAFLLKGMTEILKGEQLSTALGRGVKAGALGLIASQLAGALMDWFGSIRAAKIIPVGPSDLGFQIIQFSGNHVSTVDGMEWTRWFRIRNVTVDPATLSAINDATARAGAGDLSAYDDLLALAKKVADPEYLKTLNDRLTSAKAAQLDNDGFLSSIRAIKNYVMAAAGGAAAAATRKPVTEAYVLPMVMLEGLWADLTLKFGATKLMKTWKSAGQPTDSVEIASMMATMGMARNDIRSLLVSVGVAESDADSTMQELSKVTDDRPSIPFKSGLPQLDDEAERIFSTQGADAFARYWEQKLRDLEKQAAAGAPAPAPTPENDSWPALRNKIFVAIKDQDRSELRRLISRLTDFTLAQQDILLANLKNSKLDANTQMQLRRLIRKVTVSEQHFMELSSTLNSARMTWKDLGYSYVCREPRTETVILL
jgi:hypothetical protein